VVTCNLNTLANGGNVTISVVLSPLIEGNVTNVASVSTSSADIVAANNTANAVASVINHPAGPILRIAKIGTNAVIYWTTNSAGYQLEARTGAITGGSWQSVTNVPVVRGTQRYVTNAIGTVPKFYRLSRTFPVLSAVRSGTNVRVSWLTNFTGYQLKATPTLSQSNFWVNVTNVPAVQGNEFFILDIATNSSRFYRLFFP
jgi:hypothetical protein